MKPSAACLDLIRQSEGCRFKAYQDSGGVWTIGYGHTFEVKPGQIINWTQAEAYLESDVAIAAEAVVQLAGPSSQGQFDALTDFVFNLGVTRLKGSSLLRYHRAGNYAAAAAEFGKWVRCGSQILPGLVKRRAAEAHLYVSGELPHDLKAMSEEDDGA